jgi:hypothetical protein
VVRWRDVVGWEELEELGCTSLQGPTLYFHSVSLGDEASAQGNRVSYSLHHPLSLFLNTLANEFKTNTSVLLFLYCWEVPSSVVSESLKRLWSSAPAVLLSCSVQPHSAQSPVRMCNGKI